MKPIRFDTNSLLWFSNTAPIQPAAYVAILAAQQAGKLFGSPISIWELAFAVRKRHPLRRPDLRGMTPREWFDESAARLPMTVIPIDTNIAEEAADIAPAYGSGDPGDCFVIATAHIHGLTLVTRDARIINFAKANPDYLSVIPC